MEFLIEDKLENDVASLKRIGWNLDKVTKHLITSKEYGVKMTSDLIKKIFDKTDKKGQKIVPKPPKEKHYKYPKNPVGSQKKNGRHGFDFILQMLNDPDGSPDTSWSEAEQVLRNVGYEKSAIEDALKYLENDGVIEQRPAFKSFSSFRRGN